MSTEFSSSSQSPSSIIPSTISSSQITLAEIKESHGSGIIRMSQVCWFSWQRMSHLVTCCYVKCAAYSIYDLERCHAPKLIYLPQLTKAQFKFWSIMKGDEIVTGKELVFLALPWSRTCTSNYVLYESLRVYLPWSGGALALICSGQGEIQDGLVDAERLPNH